MGNNKEGFNEDNVERNGEEGDYRINLRVERVNIRDKIKLVRKKEKSECRNRDYLRKK